MGSAASKKVNEETFLDLCRKNDDKAAVRKALEKQPELVHCRDTREYREGFTPLHCASASGYEEMARVLLEHGAEVNAQNSNGWTPLHYASNRGHEDVARVLLEHGADVNVRNVNGWTPLYFASFHGRGEVARVLLEHATSAVELEVQEMHGWTALHYAAANGHEEVVRVMLQHGADVNAQNNRGWTPLYNACSNNRVTVARLLLEFNVDRSIRANDGCTARVAAKRCRNSKIVELLDTYFPLKLQMMQMLLGLRGPTESPLTRLAGHSTFEPKVLLLVKCLLSGEESVVFDQLQYETRE